MVFTDKKQQILYLGLNVFVLDCEDQYLSFLYAKVSTDITKNV